MIFPIRNVENNLVFHGEFPELTFVGPSFSQEKKVL